METTRRIIRTLTRAIHLFFVTVCVSLGTLHMLLPKHQIRRDTGFALPTTIAKRTAFVVCVLILLGPCVLGGLRLGCVSREVHPSLFQVASTLSTCNASFLTTIVRLLEEPFHKGNPVFTLLPLVSLVDSSGRAVVRSSKVGDGAVKESRRQRERRKL